MMESKTVLFVDDEEKILRSIKRIMLDKPFTSLYANSGPQAIEILEKHHQDVRVVITDMRMPEMSGLDLLRVIKDKYPNIIRIVLSGYTQITTLLTAINEGHIFRYIIKPWENEQELVKAVTDAFEQFEKSLALQK